MRIPPSGYHRIGKAFYKIELNEIFSALKLDGLSTGESIQLLSTVTRILKAYQASRGKIFESNTWGWYAMASGATRKERTENILSLFVALPTPDFNELLDSFSARDYREKEVRAEETEKLTLYAMKGIQILEKGNLLSPEVAKRAKAPKTAKRAKAPAGSKASAPKISKDGKINTAFYHLLSNDKLIELGCSVQIKDGFRTIRADEGLKICHEYDPAVNKEKKLKGN